MSVSSFVIFLSKFFGTTWKFSFNPPFLNCWIIRSTRWHHSSLKANRLLDVSTIQHVLLNITPNYFQDHIKSFVCPYSLCTLPNDKCTSIGLLNIQKRYYHHTVNQCIDFCKKTAVTQLSVTELYLILIPCTCASTKEGVPHYSWLFCMYMP